MSELRPSGTRRAVGLALLIVYAGTIHVVSSGEAPEAITALHLPDFLLHGVEYAGLGFLVARFLWLARGRAGWAALICLPALLSTLYGLTDEIHQSLVPGRDAALMDLLADAVGSLCGAATYRLLLAATGLSR